MLKLPKSWMDYSSQHLARDLMTAAVSRRRDAVARCLVFAAFDLGFLAKWSQSAPDLKLTEHPPFNWRIGDITYRYLRRIDDHVLQSLTESPIPVDTNLLTPPNMSLLLKNALWNTTSARTPMVMSIEDFVSIRICLSALDAGWSSQKCTRELLDAYNRRAVDLGYGGRGRESISIHYSRGRS